MRAVRAALVFAAGAAACVPLSGCLVVSYSSGSGWWVWPGSLVVTLLVALGWFLTRR
jgi:hypothetical protein